MFEWKSEVSLGSVQESEGSRSHGGLGNKGSAVYDLAVKSVSTSQDEFSYSIHPTEK